MFVPLIFLIIFIVPIPIMLRMAKKGAGAYRAILEGLIATTIAAMLLFIVSSVAGQPVGETLKQSMYMAAEILAKNTQFAMTLGIEDLGYGERLSFLKEVYDYMIAIFPASLFTWAAVIAYFEYMLTAKLVNKKEQRIAPLPYFRHFSLPRNALFGFIVVFLLSLIVTKTGMFPGETLYINVNLVFEFIFSIQGAAVLFFFCDNKRIPKVVAILLTILFLSTGFGKTFLFILGITDLAFSMRARMTRNILRR